MNTLKEPDPSLRSAVTPTTGSEPITEKADYDSPWKNILQHFLQAFVEFCLPQAAAEIDWSKGYTSLDKELIKISRQQKTGKRIADALFKVWLKTGEEVWLLMHIEVQAQKELNFCERMFIYHYRIFDRYQKPVMSVAILADNNPHWRPSTYERSAWYNKLHFEFAAVKLLDYANQKDILMKQDNPFAIIILAHLSALETDQDADQRLHSKLKITRALYGRGFTKDYILNLFLFIDWVLALPESLELEYIDCVEQLEEEKHVRYITSFERIGIQKGMEKGIQLGIKQGIKQGIEQGLEQGLQQGEAQLLIKLLVRRFGELSSFDLDRVRKADAGTLLSWGEKILDVENLEDVFED